MQSNRAPIYTDATELASAIPGGTRVVLANGCFDLLHVGHIRYLWGAKAEGDYLVVAVNDDESTRTIKGAGRPVMPERERAEVLASLAMVDAVLLFSSHDVVPVLEVLVPHCHAKGTDYTVETVPERETSQRLGVRIAIVGDPKDHATSELLRRVKDHDGGSRAR